MGGCQVPGLPGNSGACRRPPAARELTYAVKGWSTTVQYSGDAPLPWASPPLRGKNGVAKPLTSTAARPPRCSSCAQRTWPCSRNPMALSVANR